MLATEIATAAAAAAAPELEPVLIFFSALFLSLPPGAAGAEPDPEPVNVPEPE